MDEVAVRAADASAPAPTRSLGDIGRIVVAWVITLVVLMLVDDLVFGPIFWAIGALWGPFAAATVAFAIYFPAQIWLVRRGTSPEPRRVAAFMLGRLGLDRPAGWARPREHVVRSRILGGGSAILLSPVVGGVIPPMLLWRKGLDVTFVRRLSVVTAAVYASEFALLHGMLAGGLLH